MFTTVVYVIHCLEGKERVMALWNRSTNIHQHPPEPRHHHNTSTPAICGWYTGANLGRSAIRYAPHATPINGYHANPPPTPEHSPPKPNSFTATPSLIHSTTHPLSHLYSTIQLLHHTITLLFWYFITSRNWNLPPPPPPLLPLPL